MKTKIDGEHIPPRKMTFREDTVKSKGFHLLGMGANLRCLCLVFLSCTELFSYAESFEDRNLILVITEDHATETLLTESGLKLNDSPTPNLSELARKGLIFANAFCANANTGPSTASLLTGQHPHANYVLHNGDKFGGIKTNLAKILQENGYETALFGKWDFGSQPQGFSHWEILSDGDQFYNPEFWNPKGKKNIEGHTTDVITDLFLEWVTRRQNASAQKPFFALIHYNGTRKPWMPALRHLELYDDVLLPEPLTLFDEHKGRAPPSRYQEMNIQRNLSLADDLFLPKLEENQGSNEGNPNAKSLRNLKRMNEEQLSTWQLSWRPKNEAFWRDTYEGEALVRWKYQRFVKNYLRCLRGIDENVGRIVSGINEIIGKNCILFYTASKGRFLGQNGWFGDSWAYDPSSRIPMLLHDFANNENFTGQRTDLTSSIDLAPTILGICKIPGAKGMQGLDLFMPMEERKEMVRKYLYFHHYDFPAKSMVPKHYAIRSESHKLIHYYQFDEWEFFDLNKDPLEKNNLHSDELQRETLDRLMEDMKSVRQFFQDNSEISIMAEEWRRIYRGPNARYD